MAEVKKTKGKGKGRKIGRSARKGTYKKYRDNSTLARHKLKQILKSNGHPAALNWAMKNGAMGILATLTKE